jgi:hypothetical protein
MPTLEKHDDRSYYGALLAPVPLRFQNDERRRRPDKHGRRKKERQHKNATACDFDEQV